MIHTMMKQKQNSPLVGEISDRGPKSRIADPDQDRAWLIEYIQGAHWDAPRSEKLFLEGLILFLTGVPERAERVFRALQDETPDDCRAEYYLEAALAAMHMTNSEENARGERLAQKTVSKYQTSRQTRERLKNFFRSDKNVVSGEQLYYAGQILHARRLHKEALVAFRGAKKFAALYMQLVCLESIKDEKEARETLQMIIEEEYCRRLDGMNGFLGVQTPGVVDVDRPDWDQDIRRYANYLEIEEAVKRVRQEPDVKRKEWLPPARPNALRLRVKKKKR